MKGYVINLNKRQDRLSQFYKQQDTINIFERLPAIDKDIIKLTEDENLFFNVKKCEEHLNRRITWGEIACTLSHIKAWRLISENESLQDDDFAIIAEDDVILLENYRG